MTESNGSASGTAAVVAARRVEDGLRRALRAVASDFEQRIDGLGEEVIDRQREAVPELAEIDAPAAWEANRQIVVGSRRAQAASLRMRRQPESCPDADLAGARLASAAGLSRETLRHAYNISHKRTLAAWLEVIDSVSLGQSVRDACRRFVSDFLDEYDERITRWVCDAYDLEQAERLRDSASLRIRAIRAVLDRTTEALHGLDYDIGLCHVGVITWGRHTEAVLTELAQAVDRALLWAPIEDDRWMGWLGGQGPLSSAELRRIYRLRPKDETSLALGDPGLGPEGFRRTHRQAGDAAGVGRRLGRRLTFYREVSLEAIVLCHDRSRVSVADAYVAFELQGLAGSDERAGKLRETLRTYFAASQNASSAAAALGIDEKTVRRHLRAVEEKLGCQVDARRAELELALRLHAVWNGE